MSKRPSSATSEKSPSPSPSPKPVGPARVPSKSSELSASAESIGIQTRPPRPPPDGMPRLMADGPLTPGDFGTYDIVLFLFVCEEHRRSAVSSLSKVRVISLPFVAVGSQEMVCQASKRGLELFLGADEVSVKGDIADVKGDIDNGSSFLPQYKMALVNVLRIQLLNETFETRYTQVVRISKTEGYKCCRDTSRLSWLENSAVLADKVKPLWGPELKMCVFKLAKGFEAKYIYEFSLNQVLLYLSREDRQKSFQAKLLRGCDIDSDTILALYSDYCEHCFPSFYMTFESFKQYLIKYGIDKNDTRFGKFFRAVCYNKKGYLDIYEFLVGIVALDFNTKWQFEARQKLIGRYYDDDGDGFINLKEFILLLKDLHPALTDDQMVSELHKMMRAGRFSNEKISLEDFCKAVETGIIRDTDRLCLLGKKMVTQVVDKVREKRKKRSTANGPQSPKKSEAAQSRKGRGTCNGCKAQNYTYRTHCVMLDTDARTCQPKHTINKNDEYTKIYLDKKKNIMTPARYSDEIRFATRSPAGFMLDTVRRRKTAGNLQLSNSEIGDKDGWFKPLCNYASAMFSNEDRLIKLNSPAIMVGDILGNLPPLAAIYKTLCPSFPIMQETLVFLGNYFGPGRQNVEVILMLLSLKLQAPEKIYLLRGFNEDYKQVQTFLLSECQRKFGTDRGNRICSKLMGVIERMPFAALIDEYVLCVNSGIPSTTSQLSVMYNIPNPLANVQDNLFAYELISRTPRSDSDRSARVSTQFTSAQFRSFIIGSDISHLVRGHDPLKDTTDGMGYRLDFQNQCITLNSSGYKPTLLSLDPGKKLNCKTEINDIFPAFQFFQIDAPVPNHSQERTTQKSSRMTKQN